MTDKFLQAGKDRRIFVTVVAKDAAGKGASRPRSWAAAEATLYDGPVRAPNAAVAGSAILRVEFESTTGKVGVTTEISVTLK